MRKVSLYTNFITEYNRFGNRQALLDALNNSERLNFLVEGCEITSTSSYVDIAVPSHQTDIVMFRRTYMLIDNDGQNSSSYLAFVNRVEPNNFNDYTVEENGITFIKRSYRFYISIDWWSTIMYNDIDNIEIPRIKKTIEGNVVRAHVNVYERGKGANVNKARPYPYNTNEDMEYNVTKTVKKSSLITNAYSTSEDIQFLYILTTKGETNGVINIGDVSVTSPSTLAFLPIYKDLGEKEVTLIIRSTYTKLELHTSGGVVEPYWTIGETVEEEVEKKFKVDSSIYDKFTDSSIKALFISPICPYQVINDTTFLVEQDLTWLMTMLDVYDGRIVNLLGEAYNRRLDWYLNKTIRLTAEGDSLINCIEANGLLEHYIQYSNTLNTMQYNLEVDSSLLNTSYEAYLQYLVKDMFFPYTYEYIQKGEDKLIIDRFHTSNAVLYEVAPNLYGNAYIVKTYSKRNQDYTSYSFISDNGLYAPFKLIDIYTYINSSVSAISSVTNVIGNVLSVAGSLAGAYQGISNSVLGLFTGKISDVQSGYYQYGNSLLGAVKGGVNVVNSGAQSVATFSQIMKTFRDGETGTTLMSSAVNNFVDVLREVSISPTDEELYILRRDLAKFGYTTYLHPHDVLEDEHLRYNFNYYLIDGAVVTDTYYNQDIRNSIASMFNNGVWLWNRAENFGNYEVQNFQQNLIDEV